MVSTSSLLFASTAVISNLITLSLSGGCRYANFETSGVSSYGPILIDPTICPTFDLDVGFSYYGFDCGEPAPGFIEPEFSFYTSSSCSGSPLQTDFVPGDCTLPEIGCNIYDVELRIISGTTNCGIIQPDDDCEPTCDIGFPEIVGTISMTITDGGANQCLQIGVDESVLYSDITIDGFDVQVFNNNDCSGTPVNTIDYSAGCRSDDVFITITLLDPAEVVTTPAPVEE